MENLVLELKLTVRQVNLVLQALGKQPFENVFETVKAIKEQGDPQVKVWIDANPPSAPEEPKAA